MKVYTLRKILKTSSIFGACVYCKRDIDCFGKGHAEGCPGS